MHINSLTLNNFRNHSDSVYSFTNGINVLYGKNGAGKTNCAEAVFLLCTGYSGRTSKEKELITHNESFAKIGLKGENAFGNIDIEIKYLSDKRRIVKINDIVILKISELLGNINSVYFSPDELRFIKDGPEFRRRFLDISLCQVSKAYFSALNRYNKILAQRNNLIKQQNESVLRETLPVWDQTLSENAAKIIHMRQEFIKTIAPFAKEIHNFLTDKEEELDVCFENNYSGETEEIRAAFLNTLKKNFEKDIRLGFTSAGPHRDDMVILINKQSIKSFGSQGQQRTGTLSFKLAEAEIFKSLCGEYPVLILDDVLSELDGKRQRRLLSRINGIQTFITCTHIDKTVFKNCEFNKINIQ